MIICQRRKYPNESDEIKGMRADLLSQLNARGFEGKVYENLIEAYLFYLRITDEMQKDIEAKGTKYKRKNGNGFMIETDNPNIKSLIKSTSEMLKIFDKLGLSQPVKLPTRNNEKVDPNGLLSRD